MPRTVRLDIVVDDTADRERARRMLTTALTAVVHANSGHEGLLIGRRTLWDDGTTVEPLDIWPSSVVDKHLPALD